MSPTTLPSMRSIFSAAGRLGSPGMVIIFPQTGTIMPAPADNRISRTVRRQPLGRPSLSLSSESEDWVLAMHTGSVA